MDKTIFMKAKILFFSVLYSLPFFSTSAQNVIGPPAVLKFPPTVEFYRNDTIFSYTLYLNSDSSALDSTTCSYDIPYKRNKWISFSENGDYQVSRFKKRSSPSYFFLKYNDTVFHAEYEMICREFVRYNAEGKMIFHRKTLLFIKDKWYFCFAKKYSPPKKVKSKYKASLKKSLSSPPQLKMNN